MRNFDSILAPLIDDCGDSDYFKSLVSEGAKKAESVTRTDSIEVGDVDGSKWVRVNGKGNFMSSPRLKEFLDGCLDGGCDEVVVDLEPCPAMDSTFMGTLAGLALKLQQRNGNLSVVGLSERNRESLVDLGLDSILQLEGEGGQSPWNGRISEIREGLILWEGRQNGAAVAEEVLDAHRKLCDVDDRNSDKFGAVLSVLEQECATNAAG